jgi:predicted transport protein
MEYVPSKPFSLRGSTAYSERWLQDQITNDPSIMGLGSLEVVEYERRQLNGGRLDLLLNDDTAKVRYCVELQLGPTDETHIIRTLEYWDNERSRNPHIDHIAVIVAEDITTRFLNVIQLFNKSVPLIAIQVSALQVGENITLNFVKVLDIAATIGWEDDGTAGTVSDRGSWLKKSSPQSMDLMDKFIDLIRASTNDYKIEPKFNKYYVGLARNGVPNNFVSLKPQRQAMRVEFKIPRDEDLTCRIEENLTFISYDLSWNLYQVKITESDFTKNEAFLRELVEMAAKNSKAMKDNEN